MDLEVLPYGPEWTAQTRALHQRLGDPFSELVHFDGPVDPWLPPDGSTDIQRESRLAVSRSGLVVGSCTWVARPFRLHGVVQRVAGLRGPFADLDASGSAVSALVDGSLKEQPFLYVWDQPDRVRMLNLRSHGWRLLDTPLCTRVLRPASFLRKCAQAGALGTRLARLTGLGWLGLTALDMGLVLRAPQMCEGEAEEVPTFSFWADELWNRCAEHYAALSVRDPASMNRLLPKSGWPAARRLRVMRGRQLIGWAVVMDTENQGDARFGSLRVGSIIDCLAVPEDACDIVGAALAFLRDRQVDLVISHQSHPAWIQAFADNAFRIRPGRRSFAASPELRKALDPLERARRGLHLTALDGVGPLGL